jgi:hypothetical protein
MMIRGRLVRLGCILMMFGGFSMGIICHLSYLWRFESTMKRNVSRPIRSFIAPQSTPRLRQVN